MQSSLRVPKYKACVVRMQRQLHESRKATTMSMDLSVSSSSSEGEGYGGENIGDRSAGNDADARVTFRTETKEQDSDIHHIGSGDCLGRDRNIDGVVRRASLCDDGSRGCSLDVLDSSRHCDRRAVGDIAGSNAALRHEDDGESFVEAQEPEEEQGELEGGDGLAIEREWSVESTGVQVEATAPVEAATSRERGRAKKDYGRSGRRRRSKGRSNGKGRDASRDTGRRGGSKERRRGLRAATSHPSRQRRKAREPPVPSVEEGFRAIPPSVPSSFVGGHDGADEVSELSFTGKLASARNVNGSMISNDTLPTVISEFNEMQSNGDADPALKINPIDYDTKGRCVRHPQMRLRKKKLLGGWKVLLSACPNCCVEELCRIQLAENNKEKPLIQQQRSQDCRPLLGRAASQNSFQDASIENMASLPARSSGSNYQHDADKEQAATHKKKKSNRKGKDRKGKNHRDHYSKPQEQPKMQNKRMHAVKMQYTDEDNQVGTYDGQLNADLVPHGHGTMVYAHDGSAREGEWENGRYRPQSSLNLNSSASRRSGQKKSVRSRSTSRDKRHRRRPACSAEYCH